MFRDSLVSKATKLARSAASIIGYTTPIEPGPIGSFDHGSACVGCRGVSQTRTVQQQPLRGASRLFRPLTARQRLRPLPAFKYSQKLTALWGQHQALNVKWLLTKLAPWQSPVSRAGEAATQVLRRCRACRAFLAFPSLRGIGHPHSGDTTKASASHAVAAELFSIMVTPASHQAEHGSF